MDLGPKDTLLGKWMKIGTLVTSSEKNKEIGIRKETEELGT